VQLLALRPDLDIQDIRGNVDTRLRKRDEGRCVATVLAMAGLARLGITRPDIRPFSVEQMVPAVGQGALGIQCREGDRRVLALLAAVEHPPTRRLVDVERAFLAAVGGGCNVPAGCHAVLQGGTILATACHQTDDAPLRRASARGDDPQALGHALALAISQG
jgi:hydroxymethylbilane synthase